MKKLTPILLILALAAIAVGLTFWRGRTQPVLQAELPVVDGQNQVVQQLSTADWKTCRNEKYRYEIKYPSDWKVWKPGAPEARLASCDEDLGTVALSPDIYQNKAQLNISVNNENDLQQTVYKGSRSLDDYFSKNPDILKTWSIEKEANLDGERMVWLRFKDQRAVYVFHNDFLFEFDIYNNADQVTLDKLFSTFKFLDTAPVSTADWKTYRNDDIGISFKYPATLNNPGVETINNEGQEPFSGKSIRIDIRKEEGVKMAIRIKASTVDYNGFLDTTYTGKDDIICNNPLVVSSSGTVCKWINIGKIMAVFQNEAEGAECSLGLQSTVIFKNPGHSIYRGIEFGISLNDVNAKLGSLFKCDEDAPEFDQELVRQSGNIILLKNLSSNDSEQLSIFNTIVSSVNFY